MKIYRIQSKCGGYQKAKGHLDTQLYPECEGTPEDRDIVKKNREKKTTAKKKEYKYNPWAVCNSRIDKDKEPEKYERCVQKVKKQQEKKESSCKSCQLKLKGK